LTSPELDAHLRWLLERLEPAESEIRSLVAQSYDLAIVCVFSATPTGGGPTIEPQTLTRLARLGLPLDFDVYS
jgi:hypothetical protein